MLKIFLFGFLMVIAINVLAAIHVVLAFVIGAFIVKQWLWYTAKQWNKIADEILRENKQ